MDIVRQDLRYALRSLRKTPGFTAVAVLLLALGVGASTAVFSVVNAVYFSAVPYPDADRLVMVEQVDARPSCTDRFACARALTTDEVREWPARLSGVASMAGLSPSDMTVAGPTVTEYVTGAVVSANFFHVLGLRPFVGRTFTANDDRPGATDVVVLSHAFWQTHFGGDTSVVGRSITMDGRPYRVIGIMPASAWVGRPVYYADPPTAPFFIPMEPLAARLHSTRAVRFTTVVARLDRDASIERFRAGLDVMVAGATRDPGAGTPSADDSAVWTARVTPLRTEQAKAFASSYPVLFGAVLFVALVACANLAGLFLARLSGRRQEILVRAALGASRGRLARQFMVEGVLVAAVGGAAGVVCAHWGTDLARVLLPARGIPYWTTFVIDAHVLAFALVLTVVGGAIFGVGPALMLAWKSTGLGMREVSGTLSSGRDVTRVRGFLVSTEIACTLVLLTGAGLLGKTFFAASTRDIGMAKRGVVRGALRANGAEYDTPAKRRALAQAVLQRLQRIPGAEAAALMAGSPPGEPRHPGIVREGDAEMIVAGIAPSSADGVTADYFRAMGIPVVQGRAFTAADGPGAPPVAIISEPTARRLFPGGSAVGRRIKFGPPSSHSPWMTIVGVVGGTRGFILPPTEPYHPAMYRPLAQAPAPGLGFAIRTRGPDAALIPAVREAMHDVAPNVPLALVTTIEEILDTRWLAPVRANTVVLGALAAFALIIAGLGLYGVVAYLVTERTREIGVRMALGASGPAVVRVMMRSAIVMVVWGVAGGVAGSYALTRVLRAFLYGNSPTDPQVFVGATLVLVIAALAAAYFPARRATRVDPMLTLRTL